MPRPIRIELTRLEAECLLELAQEAEMEIMADSSRRWKAAHSALDKMLKGIARGRGVAGNSL